MDHDAPAPVTVNLGLQGNVMIMRFSRHSAPYLETFRSIKGDFSPEPVWNREQGIWRIRFSEKNLRILKEAFGASIVMAPLIAARVAEIGLNADLLRTEQKISALEQEIIVLRERIARVEAAMYGGA
jgi:hypothetical protein